MPVPKIKTLLTVCAVLFLTACGQPLSEREVVRAVFFARPQGQYSVCLLLADQKAAEETPAYKTVSASGATAAKALHAAEAALPGQPYYGLLDLAALPPDCDWKTAQELGNLFYEKAQPAPELSVFLLDNAAHSWAEDAAALYENMRAVATQYHLHCGLQQLFAQQDGCAVPVYRPADGYDFALLAKSAAPRRFFGLAAQLAAALCGRCDRMAAVYSDGEALCRSRIFVTVSGATVQVHLRDSDFQNLTQHSLDLQGRFTAAMQRAFAALMQDSRADFFHLRFWYANLYGAADTVPAPRLELMFE